MRLADPGGQEADRGVVTWGSEAAVDDGFFDAFEEALAAGRHWDREMAAAMV